MINIDSFISKRTFSTSRQSKILIGVLLLTSVLTGCTSFKKHDPCPVGMFYPSEPIRGVYFPKADFFQTDTKISFSQPVKISEVGIMTWNSLTGNKSEVARLESPQLEHLPGDFYIGTEGDYYASISWLREHGTIVYNGYETTGESFWKSITGFFGTVWGIILVLLALALFGFIASLFGGGGGTWSGGGTTSSGGSWSGGGTYK